MSSIKRAEEGESIQYENLKAICDALGAPIEQPAAPPLPSGRGQAVPLAKGFRWSWMYCLMISRGAPPQEMAQ